MNTAESKKKPQNKDKDSFLNRKIVSPQKLKILVLSGNDLMNDQLQFLHRCINLIKLDVSYNNINRLPHGIKFGALKKLQVIHLHHNKITHIEGIQALFESTSVSYLTYFGNPIQERSKIQHQIVNKMPSLKAINSRIVFVEERSPFIIIERGEVKIQPEQFDNLKTKETSESYYLKVLGWQLRYIDNMWAINNPIVYIQRAWRHFSINQSMEESRQISISMKTKTVQASRCESKTPIKPISPILKLVFDEWKRYSSGIKETKRVCQANNKEYLTYCFKDYVNELKNKKIREPLLQYLAKVRRRLYQRKMGKRLMANLNLKRLFFNSSNSFYSLSGIQEFKRFYFNKSQMHILQNFLILIGEQFNKREAISVSTSVKLAKHFVSIRFVDPQTFSNKIPHNSFCTLMWPSMKMVLTNKKKIFGKIRTGIVKIKALTYIKNRDKVLSQLQYQKSSQCFKMLQKFAQQQYEGSLYYFESEDEFVMKQLLRMIYYHNTKATQFQIKNKKSDMMSLLQNYNEPFVIYTDNIMKRTAAAVCIQKTWRRYISNKHQKESIYQKMKKNRAALRIQKFLRERVFFHRFSFQKRLYLELEQIKGKGLLFEEQVYLNLQKITNQTGKLSLFKSIQLSRATNKIGVSSQFLLPILSFKSRQKYLNGKRLGTINYPLPIDIYNLIHFGATVKVIECKGYKLYCFQYENNQTAVEIASILAILSYQIYQSAYFIPLIKENISQIQQKYKEWRYLKCFKSIKEKRYNSNVEQKIIYGRQIKPEGLFLFKNTEPAPFKQSVKQIEVEFYQKRYHDFPLKHVQTLHYIDKNVDAETVLASTHYKVEIFQNKTEQVRTISRLNSNTRQGSSNKHPQNYLNVTQVDKKRLSMYDFGGTPVELPARTITQEMSKTVALDLQNKREKVTKQYKEEFIKKQAQKQMKNENISSIRQKIQKEKQMNLTIKNMKDLERTQMIKQKVQKVKSFKNRVSENKSRDQADFIQQGNFVMEQQLKMIIMRTKMKDTQGKKKDNTFFKRNISTQKKNDTRQIHSNASRKSQKAKSKIDFEEIVHPTIQLIGNEGSIINTRKKQRKLRTNSIGAYIRDPAFVHGVFPEEYYPIQNRSINFYFPPV